MKKVTMALLNEKRAVMDRPDSRSWLGVLGVLLTVTGLALITGPIGVLLAGSLLVAAWYLLAAPFVFALAQLAVVALFLPDAPLGQLVLIEAGLLIVLASPMAKSDKPIRAIIAMLLAFTGLGVIGWGVLQSSDALWPIALTLAGSTAIAAYGLHRYERVRLDLIEEA